MTTQSIIVYRNPVEQAMWEGQYAAYLVPIGGAALAFLLTYLAVTRLCEFVIRKMGKSPYYFGTIINGASLFSALTVAILTLQFLWV